MKSLQAAALAAVLIGTATAAWAADTASQKFIKEAIEGSLAEVKMGELAQQNGQADDVKSFGKMLVTDHGAAAEEAKKVAGQIGAAAPAEPNAKQKAMYDKMAKMKGADFDREFKKEMIADHKKDIAAFQKQAKMKNDPAVDFAGKTLPTLQKHLDAAQKLTADKRAAR